MDTHTAKGVGGDRGVEGGCRWGVRGRLSRVGTWGNKVEPKYLGIPTPWVRISVLKTGNWEKLLNQVAKPLV